MCRIRFTKTFLSGLLAGISVPVEYTTPEDCVSYHLRHLSKPEFREVYTHARFTVSGVTVEPANPKESN